MEPEQKRRKRGPYRQYEFKDSTKLVPKSTIYEKIAPKRLNPPPSRKPLVEKQPELVPSIRPQVMTMTLPFHPANTQEPSRDLDGLVIPPEADSNYSLCSREVNDLNDGQVIYNLSSEQWEVVEEDVNSDTDDQVNEEALLLQEEDEEHLTAPSTAPPDDSDHDSEDEILNESPSLHLTTRERIKALLLLSTKKRHKLTYAATESIMRLANVFSEDDQSFTPSKHILKEVIQAYSAALEEHHICPDCKIYVGMVQDDPAQCQHCESEFYPKDNKKNDNYFLYFSLKEQIKDLLESGLYNELIDITKRKKIVYGNFEDIFDGNYYKERTQAATEEFPTLTLNVFVDGLQVATTNKKSAWPVLLIINELPLHLRRKFILMASVWLGKKKINMKEYLKPFVIECNTLMAQGIVIRVNGTQKLVKIIILVAISDSIARPLLRNTKQFNGQYGCGLCLHPGFRMQGGRGFVRSYSIREMEYDLRTHEETMELARLAEAQGAARMGVKGFSPLADLEGFDVIKCLDLDVFHALVNTAKRFANLWFLEKYRRRPFSAFDKIHQVNRRLLSITPTDIVARNPRSIDERSDYRGHEWFYWVVCWSLPVMKDIIPKRYLNHWSYLVHGMALVMQNSVSRSEVVYAGRYFRKFNQDIDDLYGAENVTFSSHLLTHLQKSTDNFSQPWSHSAFVFESFLGEIRDAVKSSNGIAQQIGKHMQLRVALKKMEEDVSSEMNEREMDYLQSIKSSTKTLAAPHLTVGSIDLLGQSKVMQPSLLHFEALRRANVNCDPRKEVAFYDRCRVDGEVYQTCNYSRVTKQNNSVVLLSSEQVFQIHFIVIILDNCYALGHFLIENRRLRLCDCVMPHIRLFNIEPERMLRCIPISTIQSKLLSFTVVSERESFRVTCVNVLKMEMLT